MLGTKERKIRTADDIAREIINGGETVFYLDDFRQKSEWEQGNAEMRAAVTFLFSDDPQLLIYGADLPTFIIPLSSVPRMKLGENNLSVHELGAVIRRYLNTVAHVNQVTV